MQELTLQLEGLAQAGQPIDVAATRRRRVKNPMIRTLACSVRRSSVLLPALSRVIKRLATCIASHRERLEEVALATAGMCVGIVLLYLAAVLQGGAA